MEFSLLNWKNALLSGAALLSLILCQQTVAANTTQNDDRAGKVTIGLIANQHEVMPGGAVLYTIEVRNHDKRTQDTVDVSFQFDPTIMQIVDVLPRNGTLANDNTALWKIDAVYAGKTWSTSFLVYMRTEVKSGTTTDATVRVSGPQIQIANSVLSDTLTVGAAVFPPTGSRFDILFLCISMLGTTLIAINTMKKPEAIKEVVAA